MAATDKTQMRFGGRPVGMPLSESQGALNVRWLNSEGVMEALAEVAPLYADAACHSCVHRFSEHDPETGACLRDHPTFGPCPCEGWRPLDVRALSSAQTIPHRERVD